MNLQGRLFWTVWIAVLFGPRTVGAGTVEAEVSPSSIVLREDAPFFVKVTLHNRGQGLTSGRLQMDFTDADSLLRRFTTREISLGATSQSYRFLVPPLEDAIATMDIAVRLRFISPQADVDLGEHVLFRNPRIWKPQVLAVCVRDANASYFLPLVSATRLEHFERKAGQKMIATFPVFTRSRELPDHALEYCAYDGLILESTTLVLLNRAQQEAIAGWVRAGGRLLIFSRVGPESRVMDYVNDLARTHPDGPVYTKNEDGSSVPDPDFGEGPVQRVEAGLGRVVVVYQLPSESEVGARAWREAISFFWSIRGRQRKQIITFGKWTTTKKTKKSRSTKKDAPSSEPLSDSEKLSILFPDDGTYQLQKVLTRWLLPSRARVLTLAAIFGILLLFALLVGPVDYVVLGSLRRRHLTWLFFPIISITIACFTLFLSKDYLGRNTSMTAIEIIDLDLGASVVRRNSFELEFRAGERHAVNEERDGLLILVPRAFSTGTRPRIGPTVSFTDRRKFPEYAGDFPSTYTVSFLVRTWTPHLARRLEIAPSVSLPDLNWDATMAVTGKGVMLRRNLREQFIGSRDFKGSVYVIHGGKLRTVRQGNDKLEGLVRAVSPTLFGNVEEDSRLISPSSPRGGWSFGELALCTGRDEHVLIVTERAGSTIRMYRKICKNK